MNDAQYTTLPSDSVIEKTVENLKKNNIDAIVVDTKEEAKEAALSLLPQGAQVMNMTSVTLDSISISGEILKNGRFDAVRNTLVKMDRATQSMEMQKLGAAPEYAIGSVHAVTQDGHVLIASAGGSQLSAYASGAAHVIWVVGAQKIVKDIPEGMDRIYKHSLPLENERALKAYGTDSIVGKILIVNAERRANRVKMILIKEVLGF